MDDAEFDDLSDDFEKNANDPGDMHDLDPSDEFYEVAGA